MIYLPSFNITVLSAGWSVPAFTVLRIGLTCTAFVCPRAGGLHLYISLVDLVSASDSCINFCVTSQRSVFTGSHDVQPTGLPVELSKYLTYKMLYSSWSSRMTASTSTVLLEVSPLCQPVFNIFSLERTQRWNMWSRKRMVSNCLLGTVHWAELQLRCFRNLLALNIGDQLEVFKIFSPWLIQSLSLFPFLIFRSSTCLSETSSIPTTECASNNFCCFQLSYPAQSDLLVFHLGFRPWPSGKEHPWDVNWKSAFAAASLALWEYLGIGGRSCTFQSLAKVMGLPWFSGWNSPSWQWKTPGRQLGGQSGIPCHPLHLVLMPCRTIDRRQSSSAQYSSFSAAMPERTLLLFASSIMISISQDMAQAPYHALAGTNHFQQKY